MGKQGWNLITAMADDCIEYITTQTSTDPKRPWFIHYAPGATHAPHHPTPEWVRTRSATCISSTTAGTRSAERIFENQKKLGVVPANAKLPPWPDFLPKWETLTADQKKLYLRQINVWAAYMAYTDHEIGRIVETVEKLGLFDNTLIICVCGDNGMSAEGSMHGTPNEVAYFNGFAFTVEQMLPLIPAWGTDQTYPHFAVPWAFAMDTPYRWVQADRLASRRHAHRHGGDLAQAHQGRRRHPPPVPPRHRHHTDDLRCGRHPAADDGERHRPAPVGRGEHGLHLGQGRRRRARRRARPSISRSSAIARSTTTAGWPTPFRR